MSAASLREAAKVLRERTESATTGPWWNAVSLGNVVFSGTGLSDDIAITEDFDKREDADYIATMHPGVGLLNARLLDREADDLDRITADRVRDFGPTRGPSFVRDPDPLLVELADLILGIEVQS